MGVIRGDVVLCECGHMDALHDEDGGCRRAGCRCRLTAEAVRRRAYDDVEAYLGTPAPERVR